MLIIEHVMNKPTLVEKYNVPGPRYTSYPTVPFWKNPDLQEESWVNTIKRNRDYFHSKTLSIYIHLPFCESLCTFCGCHKRITKNHGLEKPYINSLLAEWDLYQKKVFSEDQEITELHFGGGTPTFFHSDELIRLLKGIFKAECIDPTKVELSFEAHPGNTSSAHLTDLYAFGFRRLSLGIQDYNEDVQKAINRKQTFQQVAEVHNAARKMGYTSISHDLVFGLPNQKLEHIHYTIDKTLELLPDRISLYSYAHVPWVKGVGQRGFSEEDLPKDDEKRALYEAAKSRLEEAGYIEIGMDHFALPHDSLTQAMQRKKLHRNFMGYTTQFTDLLIGLGMSAISDSWFGFAQNEKSVEAYQERVEKGELPVFRGHILTEQDLYIRKCILDLMCHFSADLSQIPDAATRQNIVEHLEPLKDDQLVSITGDNVSVPEAGVPFVRNICMAFDQYLSDQPITNLFSKTI